MIFLFLKLKFAMNKKILLSISPILQEIEHLDNKNVGFFSLHYRKERKKLMRKMIMLLGAPGSGKGTAGSFLEKEGFIILSTGNVVRKEIQEKTPLGLTLKEKNEKGEFFSDDLALEIAKKGLNEIKGNVVLDGFPRNLKQAELFATYLREKNEQIHRVFCLTGDKKAIVERLKHRRVCPSCGASYHLLHLKPIVEGVCDHCQTRLIQRPDDKEEVILNRMNIYEEQTAPLVQYYKKRGLLIEIKADVPAKDMNQEIKQYL